MSEPLTITIPTDLPAALSPNARVSWQKRHRAAKAVRETARICARVEVAAQDYEPPDRIRIDATIYWGRYRKPMDDDNAWIMLKNARDGAADAIGRNDKDFTLGTLTQNRDPDGRGYVVITLTGEEP